MGFRTLAFSDTGSDNTAVGWNTLYNDRSGGGSNTAVGSQALFSNTSGSGNVGIGFQTLYFNTTQGVDNTDGTSLAIGYQALENNLEEDNNAVGHQALQNNTTAFSNNAFGWHALQSNVTGSSNKLSAILPVETLPVAAMFVSVQVLAVLPASPLLPVLKMLTSQHSLQAV